LRAQDDAGLGEQTLQNKSVNGSPDPVLAMMRSFLTIAKKGLEEETRILHRKVNGRRKWRRFADSIQMAELEVIYAYLIRRALVLGDFKYDFNFEEKYPDNGKKADLVLRPDPKKDDFRVVIEIKWANSEKGWGCIEADARKVLRSDYDRRFLLLFPARVWPVDRDSSTDCPSISQDILKHLNERLTTGSERGSVRLACEEEFDTWRMEGDKIPFGLTLFEVEKASERGEIVEICEKCVR
jgi:hypothetical protein